MLLKYPVTKDGAHLWNGWPLAPMCRIHINRLNPYKTWGPRIPRLQQPLRGETWGWFLGDPGDKTEKWFRYVGFGENQVTQIGYKVVWGGNSGPGGGKYASGCYFEIARDIWFRVDQWTLPREGEGPIVVFQNPIEAANYIRMFRIPELEVWECRYIPWVWAPLYDQTFGQWGDGDPVEGGEPIATWWGANNVPMRKLPTGAVLASAVKLISYVHVK